MKICIFPMVHKSQEKTKMSNGSILLTSIFVWPKPDIAYSYEPNSSIKNTAMSYTVALDDIFSHMHCPAAVTLKMYSSMAENSPKQA